MSSNNSDPENASQPTTASNDNTDPTTPTPTAAKGALPTLRTLYQGLDDEDGDWEYVATYPEDLLRHLPTTPITPDKHHALVERQTRTGIRAAPLVTNTLTVQSPHIKRVLAAVFAQPEIAARKGNNVVLEPPYRQLCLRWDVFEEAVEREAAEDAVAGEHLRLLHGIVAPDVRRLRERQGRLDGWLARQQGAGAGAWTTYELLFRVFRAGQLVYRNVRGYDRFFRVVSFKYDGSASFDVRYAGVNWDGKELGWTEELWYISPFKGLKRVADLELCPAEMHPNYEAIRERVLERGRKWDELRTVGVWNYDGPTGKMTSTNRWGRGGDAKEVKGRVVVDVAAYEAYERTACRMQRLDSVQFDFDPAKLQVQVEDDDEDDDEPEPDVEPVDGEDSDSESDSDYVAVETSEQEDDGNEAKALEPLTDDLLILTPPIVFGFCLKTKEWMKFYIDYVSEVPWNQKAFDRLVLPEKFKSLILAFVESQSENRDVFDDIIEGKGQGIIMLLHGAPGLGKTLTAEAVADRLKKPLYSIQAGELGSTSTEVEERLEKILEIAARWDAILLLDEAEIFLEKRNMVDMERNKIVAIFLRLLEYYRGIMFMTTNRVESFDEAFRSRIHLKINYPDLSMDAKLAIWNNFIDLSKKKNGSTVTAREMNELARLPYNGREIRNLVKTAQLMATRDKKPLEMSHFRMCLDVLEEGKGDEGETLMI